jgi:hypothetical protein
MYALVPMPSPFLAVRVGILHSWAVSKSLLHKQTTSFTKDNNGGTSVLTQMMAGNSFLICRIQRARLYQCLLRVRMTILHTGLGAGSNDSFWRLIKYLSFLHPGVDSSWVFIRSSLCCAVASKLGTLCRIGTSKSGLALLHFLMYVARSPS